MTGAAYRRRHGIHPDKLIQPGACRNCGRPREGHARQWVQGIGWHSWTMPTQTQIKYRMIRRRRHHAATRWVTR